jgi:hypothetical protein
VEALVLSSELKKPIRVTIEVVRNEARSVPAGPNKPALPGQIKRLPFRGGDGEPGGQAPIAVGLNDAAYRSR